MSVFQGEWDFFKIKWGESSNVKTQCNRKKSEGAVWSVNVFWMMNHFLPPTFCVFQIFFSKHFIIYISITFFSCPSLKCLFLWPKERISLYQKETDSKNYGLFPKDLAVRQVLFPFFIIRTIHRHCGKFRKKQAKIRK